MRVNPSWGAILTIAFVLPAAGGDRDDGGAAPRPAAPELELRADLAPLVTQSGFRGVFVAHDVAAGTWVASDLELAARGFLPASTFKIPNSLIALETGVADGADFRLAWDGVERSVAAWNRDHTLRTAFRDSAVWYYQELARRIGTTRMEHYVRASNYGNLDVGGGPDTFWLDGALRITPVQQAEFLRDLHRRRLPFAERTVDVVLDIMVLARGDGAVLRGKTGWAIRTGAEDVGWFVGSLEGPRGLVTFATLLLADRPESKTFLRARRDVAQRALAALGHPVPTSS